MRLMTVKKFTPSEFFRAYATVIFLILGCLVVQNKYFGHIVWKMEKMKAFYIKLLL